MKNGHHVVVVVKTSFHVFRKGRRSPDWSHRRKVCLARWSLDTSPRHRVQRREGRAKQMTKCVDFRSVLRSPSYSARSNIIWSNFCENRRWHDDLASVSPIHSPNSDLATEICESTRLSTYRSIDHIKG